MADGDPRRQGIVGDAEPTRVYLHLKEVFGGRPARSTRQRRKSDDEDPNDSSRQPFGSGRDPRGLGNIVDSLTAELGWNPQLAQSELLVSWSQIVGEETAKHSAPESISEGTLMVRCASSAWAAQLRMMAPRLLGEISSRFPEAGIQSIRFRGPDAPSWKRGPRAIPGRGPRDTYG